MDITAIGKTLDQPLLISKLKDNTPKILAGLAFAYGTYDTFKAPKKEGKKRGIKNAIVLGTVVATSLTSAFGLKAGGRQIFKGLVNTDSKNEILARQNKAVDDFLNKNNVGENIKKVLDKARKGVLNVDNTKALLSLDDALDGKNELLDTFFSKKNDLSAKEIFEETGRLSILGLMPVVSGVLGGIAAEKITGESTPESSSNKIKEGTYQFLANIFMCNVGAAGALFGAERLQHAGVIKSLSPLQKLGVIMGGIFLTGVMGGSYVANFIGKKILDPVFDKHKKRSINPQNPHPYWINNLNTFTSKHKVFEKFKLSEEMIHHNPCKHHNSHKGHKSLYDERKPELLDMALHTDDIATAGVLSGFRWIEPMLPLMYTISGYRAGMGYRNNK